MRRLPVGAGLPHRLLLALFGAVPLFVSGCDIVSPSGDTSIVRVDSVTVLASGATSTVVPVRFWGIVGSDGCSSLKSVERTAWSDSTRLRFVAERINATCTLMPVPLEHIEVITAGTSDVFTVIVRQPDNSMLRISVPVR